MSKRKLSLPALLPALLMVALWGVPGVAQAGPTIEQIQQNAVNMWLPLKQNVPRVSAVEFKKIADKDDDIVLVDVRRKDEFEAGHLPGAIHIDRGMLEFEGPRTLDEPDAKIFVYCRTGPRGALATKSLLDMGYVHVTNIDDGFKGWVEAGLPIFNLHGEFVLTKGGYQKSE